MSVVGLLVIKPMSQMGHSRRFRPSADYFLSFPASRHARGLSACLKGATSGHDQPRTVPQGAGLGGCQTPSLITWLSEAGSVKCLRPISEASLASERVERQLTAILAADVAGYSLCVPKT